VPALVLRFEGDGRVSCYPMTDTYEELLVLSARLQRFCADVVENPTLAQRVAGVVSGRE
jgi:hypothetical protein